MKPSFAPGRNIAMKVPEHEYDRTVAFYRDVLGFEQLFDGEDATADGIGFAFGDKVLWLDRVAGLSQAELWLEVVTDDVEQAAAYLERSGCARRDGIEPLPEGMAAFWISSPANIIHLVCDGDDT
ncbi:VOC family protein [Luteimonas vadosa]|uniref:VOC domain-containing protein n=1 Tax=Luteimonas vadosa TaxID=1165507 RepID=A0ABP9DS86_9GAMM